MSALMNLLCSHLQNMLITSVLDEDAVVMGGKSRERCAGSTQVCVHSSLPSLMNNEPILFHLLSQDGQRVRKDVLQPSKQMWPQAPSRRNKGKGSCGAFIPVLLRQKN